MIFCVIGERDGCFFKGLYGISMNPGFFSFFVNRNLRARELSQDWDSQFSIADKFDIFLQNQAHNIETQGNGEEFFFVNDFEIKVEHAKDTQAIWFRFGLWGTAVMDSTSCSWCTIRFLFYS